MPPVTGLRVLSLDGGGVRGLSSLLILASIFKHVEYGDLDGKGSLDNILPFEYFDVITGTGIGGILAILLGRLKLTIPQCLAEYGQLSSRIVRDESPVPPLFETSRLIEVAKEAVERYSKDEPYLKLSNDTTTAKTFAFAVTKSGQTRCFRTYRQRGKPQQLFPDPDPSQTLICDAFGAMLAAPGLFNDFVITTETTSTKFSDKLFPEGLNDPVLHAVDEIRREFDRPIGLILSIGCGRVANSDIPDLRILGHFPQQVQAGETQPSSIVFDRLLRRFLSSRLASGLLAFSGTAGRLKVICYLLGDLPSVEQAKLLILEELQAAEDLIEEKLRKGQYWDKYHRFEVGPVEDMGPSDFLSVQEVDAETGKYLARETLRIKEVASKFVKQLVFLFENEPLYQEVGLKETQQYTDSGNYYSALGDSGISITAREIVHINGWEDGVGSEPLTLLVVKASVCSAQRDFKVSSVTVTFTFEGEDDSKPSGPAAPTLRAYAPFNSTDRWEIPGKERKRLLSVPEMVGANYGANVSVTGNREWEISTKKRFFAKGEATPLYSKIDSRENGIEWYMEGNPSEEDEVAPEFMFAVLLRRATEWDPFRGGFRFRVEGGTRSEIKQGLRRFFGADPVRTVRTFTPNEQYRTTAEGENLSKACGVDWRNLGNLRTGDKLTALAHISGLDPVPPRTR